MDFLQKQFNENNRNYRSSLYRIIDKYSKLQDQDGGIEVDLDRIKPPELEHYMAVSEQTLNQLDLKSPVDPGETLRAPDVTGHSQMGLDQTSDSAHHLSVEDHEATARDVTRLTVSSLDESRRNFTDTELQPEDSSEELERSLSSQGSTLVELYPSMLSRIERAWHRQNVSVAADSVLRRYRRWRQQPNRSHLGNTLVVKPTWSTRNEAAPQQQERGSLSRKRHKPILVMDFSGPSETSRPKNISLNETFTVSQPFPLNLSQLPSPSRPSCPSVKPLAGCSSLETTAVKDGLEIYSSPLKTGTGLCRSPSRTVPGLGLCRSPSRTVPGLGLCRSPCGTVPGLGLCRSPSGTVPGLCRSPSGTVPGLCRSSSGTVPGLGLGRSPSGTVPGLGLGRSPSGTVPGLSLGRSPSGTVPGLGLCRSPSGTVPGLCRSPSGMVPGLGLCRSPSRTRAHVFSRSPIEYSRETLGSKSSSTCLQDSDPSLQPQLRPPLSAGGHSLRRHLSFDSSLPSGSLSCSPQQVDEEFMKLYHKFVCQSKSSSFNCPPCRLCARNSEPSRGSSSSALAALALSPHRSALRKRHTELGWKSHPQSKRLREESCTYSPGSKRHGKELLRRRLSPSESELPCGGLFSCSSR